MDIETFAIEISEGFKPKEDLNVHTWAEKYRIVTEPSPFPGRWKTPPYQREPMEMISKIGINKIVLMWASQLGKSELLNNSIFWSICEKPSPIMFVMPTQELAESYSRTRIDPIIDSTPNIRRLVAQKKSRSSDNTITEKMFPGGSLYFCSAASPSALSSRPISMLLMDEIDRMEDDIAEEGSPIELAAKRCTNFWNHKIILTSTPLILGTSKVSHEYDQTDQRKFFVPCPHCNSYQTMDFERLKWDPLKYETVKYQCNKCEQFWTEKERKNVIAKGEWRPTATPKAKGAIGYQLNILYSFLCKGFEVAAEDWDKAKGVMARERVFFNTRLGLPFDESAAYEAIYNRVPNLEEYWDVLPFEACIITCAVDVQDDRLELEVMAWQENHENFGLEYKVIQGDPSLNDVWLQLDTFLETSKYRHESGKELSIACVAIDSGGHHTTRVYDFCARRKGPRHYCAIKGFAGESNKLVMGISSRLRKTGLIPCDLHKIGVDEGKKTWMSYLLQSSPGMPGYSHFHKGYTRQFFRQLRSEHLVRKHVSGRMVSRWVKIHESWANEALDIRVYNLWAICYLNPLWKVIKERLKK